MQINKKFFNEKDKQNNSPSELGNLLGMSLFSKRKRIANLCEKWCKQHHRATSPQNIILAALAMKLIQIKEHD